MRYLGDLEENNYYVNYQTPVIPTESRDTYELMDLFLGGYEEIPFTSAEEEMLPTDLTMID